FTSATILLVALAGCTASPPGAAAVAPDPRTELGGKRADSITSPLDGFAEDAEAESRKSVAVLGGEVLSAVLTDVMPNHGERRIVFDLKAAGYSQTVDDVLYRDDEESWGKLTAAQITATKQAASHLITRVGTQVEFREFTPADESIEIFSDRLSGSEPGAD